MTRVAARGRHRGRLGGPVIVPGVAGTWKDLTDNVNLLAANLTTQVRNIAEVTTAVARGDLSRKITVDVKGEILELKTTINTMVDQLNTFASEVTRVAREVGTEGKLGGQAQVPGVGGTWKDLTDTVNVMAANLTEQVRGIVKVVTAVAMGDLKQSLTVKSKGEVAALAETINNMTKTLATFADQVTTVAREVGVEGRLGGQANVPGATGTWKDLTGNVNLLAANLTNQVRAIAEVATAVTKGDLTRSIQVQARGEVAELKDYINTMIDNLRLTTDRNTEQDWLKTNLARFTGMLQGQRDLGTVGKMLLSELAPLVNAQNGVIYLAATTADSASLALLSAYADEPIDGHSERLRFGEGLVGQCASDARRILVTNVPENVVPIRSGLFKVKPQSLIVLPVLFEGQVKAVIELAAVVPLTELQISFLERAHDEHRHCSQQHRGHHADRGPAEAIAAAGNGAADTATRVAADQRAARAEGPAARGAQRRGRAQEPGNRAGTPRGRGEGRGARAHLEVQVRIPRQHVARAAHALEQHPHPGSAAGRQPRRQPDAQAGRVRAHHPRRRNRPAQPDQRHPGSLQDRIRHRLGRGRGSVLQQLEGRRGAAVQARGGEPSSLLRGADRQQARPQHGHGFQAPAADPEEPALERLQVHRARRRAPQHHRGVGRLEPRSSGPAQLALGGGLRGVGHRHRHPAGEAEDHLRGVPAGGREHQPQIRRHRSGSGDLSGSSPSSSSAARSSSGSATGAGSTFTGSTCPRSTWGRRALSARPTRPSRSRH